MKDKELTQEKILEAVDNIIANDGFERVGVNAIAQKAGVSKMLIYRYFGGLDELICTLSMGQMWQGALSECFASKSFSCETTSR